LVDEAIRKIVEIGGGYADVVQFLQEAQQKNYVDARLVVDALPAWGREYRRSESEEVTLDAELDRPVANPLPDLFEDSPSASRRTQDSEDEVPFDIEPSAEADSEERWWSRWGNWFTGG
jgi:hypothetical protein